MLSVHFWDVLGEEQEEIEEYSVVGVFVLGWLVHRFIMGFLVRGL
jgi:high-affinity nickel permease